MFIFTTKFNRKKAIAIVIAFAVLLCAIIIIAGQLKKSNTTQTAAISAVVKNNGQRVKFLKTLGWEVEEKAIEEQEVVIPRSFTDVYTDYNKLQLTQGFDLSKHAGAEAMRYTYKVLNYPNTQADSNIVADIIVYRGEIIAGNIQSCAIDGFMLGLEYPKQT